VWEKANPLAQDGGAQALNQHQQGQSVGVSPVVLTPSLCVSVCGCADSILLVSTGAICSTHPASQPATHSPFTHSLILTYPLSLSSVFIYSLIHPPIPTYPPTHPHPSGGSGRESDILTKAFLRKYIFYAKSRVQPKVWYSYI
jgi:hypothetical protein